MSETQTALAPITAAATAEDSREIAGDHKLYLMVYAALIAGTVLTVAMYYVHFEEVWQTVAVALLIASAKASFVAAIFMHLWHGQRDIYKIMFLTVVLAAGLLGLSAFAHFSLPGTGHYLR